MPNPPHTRPPRAERCFRPAQRLALTTLGLLAIPLILVASSSVTSLSVQDRICDARSDVPALEATVAVTLKGGLGYQPYCTVLASGGTVRIVNADPVFHNPANDPAPNRENRGQCFNYEAEHNWAKLYAGGTYQLAFRIDPERGLQVQRENDPRWHDCLPSAVLDNGDNVVRFGCTDHWTTAFGTIIIKAPGVNVDPQAPDAPHLPELPGRTDLPPRVNRA